MATSSFPTHHFTKKSSLYDHKFNSFSFNVPHNEYILFPNGFLDSNSAKGYLDYTKKIGVFHNKRKFHSNRFLDLNSAKASLECTRKIGVFHNKNKISSNMLLDMNPAKVFSENRKKIGVFHTKNKLFSNGFLDLSSSKGCLEYTKKSGVFHSKHNSSSNGFLDLDSAKGCSKNRKKIGALSSDGDKGQSMEPSFVEFITSERVKVVAMLALALALCNADRVVMSVAIVPLSHSNNWRQSFGGIVQSSFLWGYLISPVAGGTLVDIYGGKIVMGWGVALWSFATFITPWAAETSVWALLAVRTLLGIAEGVALPCMNNMIAKWFPQTERSRAVGLAMAGFQLGSAIGLTLSPILLSQGGICGPFVIFGLSGFLWLLVWISTTSSTPEGSQQISEYELQYIKKDLVHSVVDKKMQKSKGIPPFRRLLSKLPTWSIIVANSMHSWGFFVILSWMPIYFNSIHHVDLRQAAWFSAVPWSMMAVVGYFAGVLSDMMIQRGVSVTSTRKIMQSIGFIGPGMALIGLTMASSPVIASAWLTLAVGLKSFSHCGFLVNLQEIAPQYSGVLHGISNTAGTFAAIIGTVGAGFFVELVGSFKGFLLLTSFLYFSAAVFWNTFSTGERVNFD